MMRSERRLTEDIRQFYVHVNYVAAIYEVTELTVTHNNTKLISDSFHYRTKYGKCEPT